MLELMESPERVTLIARNPCKPFVDWNHGASARRPLAFLESVDAMELALAAAINHVGLDVGRVIVDRAGEGDGFLNLLTRLPAEFTGDALFIRDDGSGVLSATGRGGDRILYGLSVHDVRFYLETHDLVTGRVMMGRTA